MCAGFSLKKLHCWEGIGKVVNKTISILLLGALLFPAVLSYSNAEAASRYRNSKAREAYFEIEGNVFDSGKIRKALAKIAAVQKYDQKDPWVYLATSMFFIVKGFKGNDWYEVKDFSRVDLQKAMDMAQFAVKLGKKESQAHAHLGRMYILAKNFPKAVKSLDQARRLDPNSFYPWYLKGILFEKQKKWNEAEYHFSEAEKRAQYKYHYILLNTHRGRVPLHQGGIRKKERALKLNLKDNPGNIWMYDNYAEFLDGQVRFDEALQL